MTLMTGIMLLKIQLYITRNKLHFHIYSHKNLFFFYWNNISQFLLYLFLHQINADFLCTRAQYSKNLTEPRLLNGSALITLWNECGLWKLTVWKQRLKWNSHCIMSKKMGMVALRSSISGTSVISSMGPTISGINLILCGPAGCWEETS